ncbi:MAG: RecX family transcriptional regulator [Bacteroidota bacterium]|nr:RecX family transcriptional regulator [Bacteroidota bacterium]
MVKIYSSHQVLYSRLQKYCSYQERCQQDVEKKLRDLKASSSDANQIIIDLIQENFLKEERYARSFVRGKFKMNHWGKNKIIQNLRRKNISENLIDLALKEIDPDEYRSMIKILLQKKWDSLQMEDLSLQLHKVIQHVIQKGFEPSFALEISKQLFKTS